MGIEPTYPAWKAGVLPLNYTRRGRPTFSFTNIPSLRGVCQAKPVQNAKKSQTGGTAQAVPADFSAMKELFGLETRLERDVHLELFEHVLIHVREDDGRVRLAVRELFELLHGDLGGRVVHGADAQRDEHLVGVQARVVIAQMLHLQVLDRLDDLW